MTIPISTSFPNGAQCDRSEAEARAARLSMFQLIQNGADATVAADPASHPTRDMPRCRWYGQHRFDLDSILPDGRRVERCMDCKTHTRTIARIAGITIVEYPEPAVDERIGAPMGLL